MGINMHVHTLKLAYKNESVECWSEIVIIILHYKCSDRSVEVSVPTLSENYERFGKLHFHRSDIADNFETLRIWERER